MLNSSGQEQVAGQSLHADLLLLCQIRPEAVNSADFLWAFGTLIGNSDMHNGNLSFVSSMVGLTTLRRPTI